MNCGERNCCMRNGNSSLITDGVQPLRRRSRCWYLPQWRVEWYTCTREAKSSPSVHDIYVSYLLFSIHTFTESGGKWRIWVVGEIKTYLFEGKVCSMIQQPSRILVSLWLQGKPCISWCNDALAYNTPINISFCSGQDRWRGSVCGKESGQWSEEHFRRWKGRRSCQFLLI